MNTTSSLDLDRLVRGPIFFEPNRVSRTYKGGKLLASMRGLLEEDGDRPEEWIASTVRAKNVGGPSIVEGLSRIEGSGILFEDLVRLRGAELLGGRSDLGLLVKFIDSSIRLPAQVHPDKAFAREWFGSLNGKTEMWIILATRPGANLFIGFKEGVRRETLSSAIDASEARRDALLELLNEAPARPGDAWLIPGRMAHAIGAGCLVLEIQEPTDFTIRPEAWSGDRRLSEIEKYAGLGREAALECFDFGGLAGHRAIDECLIKPAPIINARPGCRGECLLDRASFPDFGANRYELRPGTRLELLGGPSIVVATRGSGDLTWDAGSRDLSRGDYFFLPRAAGSATVDAREGLALVECLPPLPAAAFGSLP